MAPPITKVQCGKRGRGGKGWRGDLGLFNLAGTQFHRNITASPLNGWYHVASQPRKKKKKITNFNRLALPLNAVFNCWFFLILWNLGRKLSALCHVALSLRTPMSPYLCKSSCRAAVQLGITAHFPRMVTESKQEQTKLQVVDLKSSLLGGISYGFYILNKRFMLRRLQGGR